MSISSLNNNDFDTFFLSWYDRSYRYALFLTREQNIAEDIVQEVFVKIWQRWDVLRSESNLQGYAKTMIRNHCLNHLRHLRVQDQYLLKYIEEVTEEQLHEETQWIEQLLSKLPDKRREILLLSVWEDKSYKEIAEHCGISVNTVKDHIKKAYAFLRTNAANISTELIYFLLLAKK